MLGVFAAGRILNAKTARSQLIGGMSFGVSYALFEEAVVDARTGAFVNRDLAEYLVPVHADVPQLDAVVLDGYDDKANVLGAKGLGELSAGPERPSPTRSSTPPECGCAIFPSRWRKCCRACRSWTPESALHRTCTTPRSTECSLVPSWRTDVLETR
jgi:hypothetical protein